MRIRAKPPSFSPRLHQSEGREAGETCTLKDWTLEGLLSSAKWAKTPRTKACSSQVNGSKFYNEISLRKKKSPFIINILAIRQSNPGWVFFFFFSFLRCDCCSKFLGGNHQSSLLSALHDPWAVLLYYPSTQQGRNQTCPKFTTHPLGITSEHKAELLFPPKGV